MGGGEFDRCGGWTSGVGERLGGARVSGPFGVFFAVEQEAAQRFGEFARATGEDAVAGKAAGVEGGIGKVSDKLLGVGAFDAERRRDGGFDSVRAGDFEQDHVKGATVEVRIQVRIIAGEVDVKTGFAECLVQRASQPFTVAGKQDGRIFRSYSEWFFGIHHEYGFSFGS